MAENINEVTGQDTHEDNAGGGERSEKRFRDLSNKVSALAKEKEEGLAAAKAREDQLLKEKSEAEFKANFLEMRDKYPNAKEFEADIKAKVTSGYALEDAIVSTLALKGKFQDARPNKDEIRSQALGGSADTHIPTHSKDDPSFGGDIGKMREELLSLEKNGDLRLK